MTPTFPVMKFTKGQGICHLHRKMASSATNRRDRFPMPFVFRRLVSNHVLVCVLFYIILTADATSHLQVKNLHTQSPYLLRAPSNQTDSDSLEDQWYKLPPFKQKECFAVQSSSVIRSGVSYPPNDLIKTILKIHSDVIEAMDLDVNKKLYEWNNPFIADNAGSISKQGKLEQYTLGKKIALKLISLYGSEDIGDVTFLTSSQISTKQSAHSFYRGFFHGVHAGQYDEDEENDFDTEVDDNLLRYFDRCPSLKQNDTDNMQINEFNKFLMSGHVTKIKRKITEMLGIEKTVLTNEHVWHIYLMCGYEQANFGSSPWCSLFDEESMDALEYLGDLKLYYELGFGTNISWPQGCLLLTEFFTAMEEAIDEIEGLDINEEADGYNVGLFAFTQMETVASFISALGLFKDKSPLSADNYETNRRRMFQGGEILPFSANVLLTLYECAPEDYRTAEASYLVRLFVNERAVLIPGCSDLSCSFQQVTKHYQFLTDGCHSNTFCDIQPKRDEL